MDFLDMWPPGGIVTEEEVGPKQCKKVVNQFAGGTANLGCAAGRKESTNSDCASAHATGSLEENGVSKRYEDIESIEYEMSLKE
jgi:hypothetical protein